MVKLRRYAGAVYDQDELNSMMAAMQDGWWSGGKYTQKFEKGFAKSVGARQAMTCNSGSSANLLAISALEMEKGSEVITPATTFPTTVNPIIQCGLTPVFVDIDPETLNIDTDLIAGAISDKTRLIMLPHTLGNPCQMDKILDICARYKLRLIEDACDALGSRYDDKNVGTFGDMGTFSFYPAHGITTGEGGMVVTASKKLAERVRGYRDWGRMCNCNPCLENTRSGEGYMCSKRKDFKLADDLPYDRKYAYGYIGYNLHMTEIQAAMGLAQLKKLDGFIEARKNNFKIIYRCLRDCRHFILPGSETRADPCWFAFPLIVRQNAPFSREQVTRYLEEQGVQTRPLFAGNIIRHPAYKKVAYRVAGSLTNADMIMGKAFFVGVYPGLNEEDMEDIGGIINDIDNGRTGLPG